MIRNNLIPLLKIQGGNGAQVSMMALTKQVAAIIEGRSIANRLYKAVGRGVWNMRDGYAPVANPVGALAGIRIDGVVSGCGVIGGTSNDNLELSAGVVNVAGASVAVAEDLTNAVTRGAASKYVVHALCIDSAGARSVVAGSPGDALDMGAGNYGGAGQKPLVTGVSVVRYAVTYGNTPAPIPLSDIYPGEDANVDYQLEPMDSGISFYAELEKSRTGGVERPVYASFYDLTSAMVVVPVVDNVVLTIKKGAPAVVANSSRTSVTRKAVPLQDWNIVIKKSRENEYYLDKILDPTQDEFFIAYKEDESDTFAYSGFGILNGDYNVDSKRGPTSEVVKFDGNGELRRA